MSSITSVISFFILLFVTYSYSAPVVQNSGNVKPQFEFTKGKPVFQPFGSSNVQQTSNIGSVVPTNIQKPRSSVDYSSEEATTSGDVTYSPRGYQGSHSSEEATTSGDATFSPHGLGESQSEEVTTSGGVTLSPHGLGESQSEEVTTSDSVTLSPRGSSESSSSEEATTSGVYGSSHTFGRYPVSSSSPSYESHETHGVGKLFSTTLETASDFERRAIKSSQSEEEVETSTPLLSGNQIEVTTDFQPSPSVNSFVQSTGFLQGGQSNTTELPEQDQSSEESTTRVPVKTHRLTKTVSIIPGKITETKIYLNAPPQDTNTTTYLEKREKREFRRRRPNTVIIV